jgi:adenylate kinase
MILFFGPPGSGKSVQGELLVKRNGWSWLSTGQLFRDSSDPEVLERLAKGELIDDKLTNKVLDEALRRADDKTRVVLDGYPRNREQAKWLDMHLPEHGREIMAIVVFNVPKEELIRRLAGRGRAEDSLEVIEKRLNIYFENTKPVLEFYEKENVPVVRVDGQGDVTEVHERIQKAIEACSLA